MSEKPNEIDLAFATTDELIRELKGRSEAYVFCMVGKTGTYQVTYGGSVMGNLGLIETARTVLRRDVLASAHKAS